MEAMRRLEEQVPDLVITDILMPQKEGIECIREIRGLAPNVPVIAMSGGGGGQADYLRMAALLGAAAVLAKPFDPMELVALARRLVGRSCGRWLTDEASGAAQAAAGPCLWPASRVRSSSTGFSISKGLWMPQSAPSFIARATKSVFADASAAGHGDDLRVGEFPADLSDGLDAVPTGHHDVGDDRGRTMLPVCPQSLLAIARRQHVEVVHLQHDLDALPNRLVVIDDEDDRPRHASCLLRFEGRGGSLGHVPDPSVVMIAAIRRKILPDHSNRDRAPR